MRWETEILEEVRALRGDLQEIKLEMAIFKHKVSRWSMLMTAIPVATAVVLVVLKM